MADMLQFLGFVSANWLILVWVCAVCIAYGYGGWRSALAIGTLGITYLSFRFGRKSAKDEIENATKEIVENREKAYAEIDRRNTSRSDASKRLHDGSF